jgi:hypothetical protein
MSAGWVPPWVRKVAFSLEVLLRIGTGKSDLNDAAMGVLKKSISPAT